MRQCFTPFGFQHIARKPAPRAHGNDPRIGKLSSVTPEQADIDVPGDKEVPSSSQRQRPCSIGIMLCPLVDESMISRALQ